VAIICQNVKTYRAVSIYGSPNSHNTHNRFETVKSTALDSSSAGKTSFWDCDGLELGVEFAKVELSS